MNFCNPNYECPICGHDSCDCGHCLDCDEGFTADDLQEDGRCLRCHNEMHLQMNTCCHCGTYSPGKLLEEPNEGPGSFACEECLR